MALLGTVTSTALTGDEAPTFAYSPKEIKAVQKTVSNTDATVAELTAQVANMQQLLAEFLKKGSEQPEGEVTKTEDSAVDEKAKETAPEEKPKTTKTTKAKA